MTDSFADDLDLPKSTEMRHTRLGIASFVLGMVGNCMMWGTGLLVAGLTIAETQDMDVGEMDTSLLAAGFVCLLGFVCNLVGLPLGIAGLFQKQRRQVYAYMGLCLCALTVIGWPILALVSLAMTAAPA